MFDKNSKCKYKMKINWRKIDMLGNVGVQYHLIDGRELEDVTKGGTVV